MQVVPWPIQVALMAAAMAACGDNHRPEVGTPELVLLAVSPPAVQLEVGMRQRFMVTATFDDGATTSVAEGLTWTSSNPASVIVDGDGARAIAAGTATITASKGGVSGSAQVSAVAAKLGFAIFGDALAPGIGFAPFGGSTTEIRVDTAELHDGTATLALTIPATGYAGGAFRMSSSMDLSAYDVVTFWAKASRAATLNVVGIGNDAASTALFAEWNAVPLTTTWTHYVMPLPAPGRLTAETGLFHFAEGADEGAYTIWLDDIRYQVLEAPTLGAPVPAIATESVSKQVGDSFAVNGASVTFMVGEVARTLAISRRYLTFASSDAAVATVDDAGQIVAVGVGSATITARLGAIDAGGAITVNVGRAVAPTEAAPAPTTPAADVIALFSDVYPMVPVDTWRTEWSNATLADIDIGTDHVKKYSNLVFAGIEFSEAEAIDATTMTHIHVHVWLPEVTTLRLKLVDFGADGKFGGGDDREHELSFDATTSPALVAGAWVALDIPLDSFTTLTSRAHLSQLIISSSSMSTVYIDNVYFHRSQR